MSKPEWTGYLENFEELHMKLVHLCETLRKDAEGHLARQALDKVSEDWTLKILSTEISVESNNHQNSEYLPLLKLFANEQDYKVKMINDLLPEDSVKRYRFLKKLKSDGLFVNPSSKLALYTRTYNNNIENLHYGWLIPADGVDDDKLRDVQRECERAAPLYHSRQMKRKFIEIANTLEVNTSKAKLRRLYSVATRDASSSRSLAEGEIDQRVMDFVELEDDSIVCDLRKLNHRPASFEEFFNAAEQYMSEEVETSVDDRRHDSVVHLDKAFSTQDLFKYVHCEAKSCNTKQTCRVSPVMTHIKLALLSTFNSS